MNEADDRRERIRGKVAASQERLKFGGSARAEHQSPARFPDAYPPEDYRSLAREYPWLVVAAGLGAGMLAGAILPRGIGGKFGKRALAAASIAGELALTLSRRSSEAEAGPESAVAIVPHKQEKTEGSTNQLRSRATRLASSARGNARDAGLFIAKEAIKLTARVRK